MRFRRRSLIASAAGGIQRRRAADRGARQDRADGLRPARGDQLQRAMLCMISKPEKYEAAASEFARQTEGAEYRPTASLGQRCNAWIGLFPGAIAPC